MSVGLIKQTSASVPTPPVDEQNLFIDAADDKLKKKLSTGSVVPLEELAAGVSSFEGRAGIVTSQAGDYNAAEISNTPSGEISSTNVQTALNELDSKKANKFFSTMSPNVVSENVAVPTGYSWLRSGETEFSGLIEIDLQGNSTLIFL